MSRAGKTGKKSRAKNKNAATAGTGARGALTALGRAGGWILLLGLAAGLALGAGRLEERVAEVRADPLEASVEWPRLDGAEGTWMPASERRRLTDLTLSAVSIDPTDHASLAAARERLLATGWFEPSLRLVRRPGGVIEIEGEWREPAAVVHEGGEAKVVSTGARRLPLTYPMGGAGPLRFIRGTWGSSPAPGEIWTGGDVEAGLALLRLLEPSQAWSRVAGVDVSRYVRSGLLSVITVEGAEIVWGSSPDATPAGQVDHRTRLARLEALVSDPAWIGAGRPRVELHLPRPVINESARD